MFSFPNVHVELCLLFCTQATTLFVFPTELHAWFLSSSDKQVSARARASSVGFLVRIALRFIGSHMHMISRLDQPTRDIVNAIKMHSCKWYWSFERRHFASSCRSGCGAKYSFFERLMLTEKSREIILSQIKNGKKVIQTSTIPG